MRRPKLSDAAAVHEYGRDPAVTRFMDWPTHRCLADAVAALEDADSRWESGEEYGWVITVKPDEWPIGSISCRVRGHAVDLGYVLGQEHWRRGYATEAAKAVFAWATALEGVHRIWATCDVENTASARVLEKIGMSREGVLRRWSIRPNLPPQPPRDAFVYSWVGVERAPSRTKLLLGSMGYALLVFLGTAALGFVVLPALGHVSGLFPIETEAEGAFSLLTLKGVPFLVGLSAASAFSFEWLRGLSPLRRLAGYGVTTLLVWFTSAAIAVLLLG